MRIILSMATNEAIGQFQKRNLSEVSWKGGTVCMTNDVWIAVWFFGMVILLIGAVAFKPMRKMFVICIGGLGAFIALYVAIGVFVVPIIVVIIPTFLVWGIIKLNEKRRGR